MCPSATVQKVIWHKFNVPRLWLSYHSDEKTEELKRKSFHFMEDWSLPISRYHYSPCLRPSLHVVLKSSVFSQLACISFSSAKKYFKFNKWFNTSMWWEEIFPFKFMEISFCLQSVRRKLDVHMLKSQLPWLGKCQASPSMHHCALCRV